MTGTIIAVPSHRGAQGVVAARDDGRSFYFTAAGWRDQAVTPAVGMPVEFSPGGQNRALNVRPHYAAAPKKSGSPPERGPSAQPSPAVRKPRQRQTASARGGSMIDAIRSMLSIFLVTPISLPLLPFLPLIGKLEIFSLLILPGFLGGRRAGGVRKAMAAAVIVGSAYGAVVFSMALVALKLMTGLPLIGGYVEVSIGFFGGTTVAASIITTLAGGPFVLALVIGGFIGGLTARLKP